MVFVVVVDVCVVHFFVLFHWVVSPFFLFIINKIDTLQFMCPLAISVPKRQRKSALRNDKTKRSDRSTKNKNKTNKNRSFYALEMIRNVENDVIANEKRCI